jgi:hypothetical protein
VPDPGDALKLIKDVATVIIADGSDHSGPICVVELFGLQGVVIGPSALELVQDLKGSHAGSRPLRKERLI